MFQDSTPFLSTAVCSSVSFASPSGCENMPPKNSPPVKHDQDLDYALALSLAHLDISEDREERENHQFITECNRTGNVVHERLELIDPTPDIQHLMTVFDKRWFCGLLRHKNVSVDWSSRMTTTAGLTTTYRGRCDIKLSKPLLSLRKRKDLVETLLHEMIHAFLYLIKENDGGLHHGPEFTRMAEKISKEGKCSITVYHDYEDEMEYLQKYVWQCNGSCGQIVKRSMNRPPAINEQWVKKHRETCGGHFERVDGDHTYCSRKDKEC